jgi:hypothetical protein
LEGDHYLCFLVKSTDSPTAPIQLVNVPELEGSSIPCYASREKNGFFSAPARPLLHGDRFRIVLDYNDDQRAKTFLASVRVIDLDVTLTVAPPLQPTLLRFNLGGAAAAQGLGSATAPEPGEYGDFVACYKYFQDPTDTSDKAICSKLYGKQGIPNTQVAISRNSLKVANALLDSFRPTTPKPLPGLNLSHPIVILSWPYALPGDVVPTINVSLLYNSPSNGGPWASDTYYAAGSVILCPTAASPEQTCVATNSGFTGTTTPKWREAPRPVTAPNPTQYPVYTPDGQVVWTPLVGSSYPITTTDVVANATGFEWQQTHAPALWGLSTGIFATTSRIPSSLSFGKAITGACSDAASGTPCPATVISTSQKAGDVALLISPYILHHLWSLHDKDAPNGIDVESRWTGLRVEDYLPEPVAGFSLNGVGNAYYAGMSEELFIRNLQFVAGRAWVKGTVLNNPISGSSSSATSYTTPSTSTAYVSTWFVGIAYNISGLVSGH